MEKTIRRPKDTKVYFSLHFDRPFEDLYAFKDQKLLGKVNEFKGENGGVYPLFRTKEGEQIMMKVGISYVSMEQAELNLQTELNHWDFEDW